MSILPFIQYLQEARMFFGPSDLKNRSAEQIASIVFLMMMMLEVIRSQNPSWAAQYASQTLRYNTYDNLHYSATDLGNLLAVLNNQGTFDAHIKANAKINIPLFQINRYLGGVNSDSKSGHSEDVTFFWRLEDYLRLYSNSMLRQIRRDVSTWNDLAYKDKMQLILILRREFDKHSSNVDIYLWFKQSFKLKEGINEDMTTFIEDRSALPPPGKILASYTDKDGYTVSIRAGAPEGKEMALGQRRYGQNIITSPSGESVMGGFWMNWPEDEWNISDSSWQEMSWEDRAAMEVEQQATKYKSLEDQFESYRKNNFKDRLGEPDTTVKENKESERLDIKVTGVRKDGSTWKL